MHMKQKISRIFSNLKIKQKSFVVLIFIVLIHLMFGVFINSALIRKIIKDNTVRYTCDLLLNVGSRISNQLADVINVSQNIIYDTSIYHIICDQDISSDTLGYYEARKVMESALKKLMINNEVIGTVAVFNSTDVLYLYNTDNNLAYDRKAFAEIASRCSAAEPVWMIKDGELYLCREIRDRNTFDTVGKIVISVKSTILEINGFEKENLYDIELISEDGQRANSGNMNKNDGIFLSQKDMMGKSGYYFDNDNRNMVCFTAVLGESWSLVSYTPLSTVYASVNAVLLITLIFEFIVLLVVLFINTIFVRSLLTPIQTLTGYMTEFEKNGMVEIKDTARRDEFGLLLKCFSNMTDRISFLIEKVYKESIYRKNAQLKALQSQINPHFLYNTLEIINWTAQMHGVPEISDMICNLSALFEANAGKMQSIISIESEISYVHKYCETVKIRYGDRIQFKYQCEHDCMDAGIPCLIIQPLVENAVMHGIGKHANGIVLVKIFKEKVSDSEVERIIFIVADNGRGLEKKAMEELKASLEDKAEDFETGKHSGLRNVQRRLRLIYGEEYGLTVQSRAEYYFCVTGEIPYKIYEGEIENV